jgi:Dam-replacing family
MPAKLSAPATLHQKGVFGELRVVATCSCPHCKRPRTLKRLPSNFKCADIICDFCGYLAQVNTCCSVRSIETVPNSILGAAWRVHKERMDASIYFPLFHVLASSGLESCSIFYLAADLQVPEMFSMRKPLSDRARRAGWQGFVYNLRPVRDRFVRIVPTNASREKSIE